MNAIAVPTMTMTAAKELMLACHTNHLLWRKNRAIKIAEGITTRNARETIDAGRGGGNNSRKSGKKWKKKEKGGGDRGEVLTMRDEEHVATSPSGLSRS